MVAPKEFDEQAYLIRYPDVADAVSRGTVTSGLAHFETHGLKEGRLGSSFPKTQGLPRWWNAYKADEHLLGRFDRKINLRTIADLNDLLIKSLPKIDRDITFVAGVPRSGLLVANLIALHLNVPLVTLDALLSRNVDQTFTRRVGKKHETPNQLGKKPKILVVDDCIGTGQTLQRIRTAVSAAGLEEDYSLTYLAAYAGKSASSSIDCYFELLEHPRVFEWNLLHHDYTNSFCVDMDGIICEDPTADENDDGERYSQFLSNARPKVLPTRGVGAIVTSRLEKFRPQTIAWLDRHQVTYKRLIMLDLPSGAERRRLGAHAKYKADVYQVLGGYLFVESEAHQAQEIFQMTGMPVYCYTTGKFLCY